jgi:Rne/Rng family ribonuclease
MSKELVIAANRHETRVAVLEDDQLVEIYFQRSNEYSLAGSIHKGRVTRVLPGMQSAFVDLGLERDTFLYVSDFFEENEDYDKIPTGKEDRPARPEVHKAEHRTDVQRSDVTRRDARTQDRHPTPQPIARTEEAPAEEPVAAAPVAPATGPPGERAESPEQRGNDRGGRRSRRRRGRGGRGFPDSKYATTSTDAEPQVEAEVEAAEPEAAAEPQDIILLPGESLAKYSRPSRNEERTSPERTSHDRPRHDRTTNDRTTNNRTVPERSVAESHPEPEPATTSAAEHTPVASEPEPILSSGFPEMSYVPPPSMNAPVPSEEAKAESKPAAEPPVEHRAQAVESEIVDQRGEAEVAALEARAFEEALSEEIADSEVDEPGLESDEEEAGEIAEALEDAEDAAEKQESDTEGELGEKTSEPGEAASGEEAGKPLAASVRDQGTRYMHRGPRGMRRRRRGDRGDRPAERTDRPERPERTTEPVAEERLIVARPEKSGMPSITDLLKEGQEIIVQIAKEPLGQKGARITSHIALPGRYVVFMPSLEHLGVSRKIESDEERLRLKRILQAHHHGITGGFIVRTAGEGKSEDDIAADMQFLYNLWLDIRQKAEKRPAPLLLHHDLDIVQRILRDQITDNFKSIWVDNEDLYESVLRFMQRFQPALVSRVKMYTRSTPIFDAFNITPELEKALRPKVWLKSGGYIVINQTEALVAIDINTGKYVGKSNRLEDTIVKTNTEAVREIVRQIRLRDLGGIIVVDFIDMDERKNRQKVMQALEEAMRADRAPYKILQFNDFGLVAITRKRVKQSLERTLCQPCPTCEGAGYVKSVQTVVGEILIEANKIRKAVEGNKDVMLRVNPEVAKVVKSASNKFLEEMEEVLGRPVIVTSDPALHPEKFDLA